MLAAEVSNRTSPVLALIIENENGEATYLNWRSAFLESDLDEAAGRGNTDAGTW